MRLRNLSLFCIGLLAFHAIPSYAEREDLGNGFMHHGVATPVSNHRGTVATVDGDGRDVVLVWLFDHRGGYALLMIDALTGKSEEFDMPFDPSGDCPYSSILSSKNKFYTHFNSHFCEFDPVERAFTFVSKTAPQMTMGMTEDDRGVIWSVSYPQSGVVSFDPESRTFNDYGHVYAQNWRQYQRYVASDDAGWVYFGIGSTASQIIAFDPKTSTATPIVPEEKRVKGSGYVVRANDGKVYGHGGADTDWYELHNGIATSIEKPATIDIKPYITSSQGLFHTQFPSGRKLIACDTVERTIVVEEADSDARITNNFDYESEGAHIMGIAVAPDGTVCGGTAFPMRFFSYDPKANEWTNRASFGQWNTVARQDDRFFVGGYGGGFLLEWDPSKPWVPTVKGSSETNPAFHTQITPVVHRPHDLLAHEDGNTVILAGTPGYGYTGGGLLFWDRAKGEQTVLEHTEILPELSTQSLAALPNRKILGGTTTSAGTGGEKKAEQAELYIMDMDTMKLEWHAPLFPGAQGYTDLYVNKEGIAFGVVDQHLFFVFDAESQEIIHQFDTKDSLGSTISHQGPRVFVASPTGELYMLFRKGIAQVDTKTYEIRLLAESPVSIGPGGDMIDGRIYFGSGSHLYSYGIN